MMIELRFIVPNGTSTESPRLQYRVNVAVDASGGFCPGEWADWKTVPLVGVSAPEFSGSR